MFVLSISKTLFIRNINVEVETFYVIYSHLNFNKIKIILMLFLQFILSCA